MPEAVQRRLPPAGAVARPPAWSAAVLLSLLAGAATHVVWDSFTHGGAAGVVCSRPRSAPLHRVRATPSYVFSVLQHASSTHRHAADGRVDRAVVSRRAPHRRAGRGEISPPRVRRWLLPASGWSCWRPSSAVVASRFPDEPTLRALQPFARRLIVAALSSLVVALTVYAVVWHWVQSRAARAA